MDVAIHRILSALASEGVTAVEENGQVVLYPGGRASPALVARAREHKAGLLAALTGTEPARPPIPEPLPSPAPATFLDIVESWCAKPAPVERKPGVSRVVIIPPVDSYREPKVIARATMVLSELVQVCGIVIERGPQGRAIVRLPENVIKVPDDECRRDIESAIFAALRDKGFLLIEREDVTLAKPAASAPRDSAPTLAIPGAKQAHQSSDRSVSP